MRVVDMGAGKGYLTFAAHVFLSEGGGSNTLKERQVRTTGVETRQVSGKGPSEVGLWSLLPGTRQKHRKQF